MHRTAGDASERAGELSGATDSSSVRESPSEEGGTTRLDEDESTRRAAFPADGRQIWIPPNGPPREVEPGTVPAEHAPSGAEEPRSCPDCSATRSIETLVREHTECGHVGLDGFVGGAANQTLSCPKCEAVADGGCDAADAFSVVGTVYSCLECGRVLDRPLGPGIDGDP